MMQKYDVRREKQDRRGHDNRMPLRRKKIAFTCHYISRPLRKSCFSLDISFHLMGTEDFEGIS